MALIKVSTDSCKVVWPDDGSRLPKHVAKKVNSIAKSVLMAVYFTYM